MIIEIPENITRKELHEIIFGIDPPELDSPYCSCSLQKGCENCKHKDDMNCDVNWWNAPYVPKGELKSIKDEETKALAGLIENRINAACADLRENKIIDVYEKLNAIHKAFSTLQNKLEGENK